VIVRRLRVYVDTSVFGGVADEEFAEPSKRFFVMVAKGRFLVLVSQVVLDELVDAPAAVQEVLTGLTAGSIEEIPAGEEAGALAQAYIDAGAVGETHRADALQVAAATVGKADMILSWNFRHIVNFERIHRYNAVNMMNGYTQIEIRSPQEVVYGDEDEDL
jgi:predicted nucleic acid-binding protein